MKQVVALLLIALTLVVAFAALTGGGADDPLPSPPVPGTTQHRETIGVLLPNDSVVGDQIRNGIDTAYLLQDTATRPSLVYLNGTQNVPSDMVAVITATDALSEEWDAAFESPDIVHLAVASPGYAASAPEGVVTFSTPPSYEIASLKSLLRQHDAIAVLGPDTLYTAAYIQALEDAVSGHVVSGTYSSPSGELASLRSLLDQKPGLLIITGGSDVPAVVAKAREFGLTGPVLVSSWVGEDAGTMNDPRMEGVYTAKRISDISSHPFYNVYSVRFDTSASVYAAEGYDAMMTLSRLVPQSNGNTVYISGWYMDKTYEGAAGSYEFDISGCGRILMQIAQFRSGSVVLVDTYAPPPSEVVIGVYGNAEVVRGATAAAEFINTASQISLPGAATSGISGIYGAKVRILPLESGSPVPSDVVAVVGDMEGVVTNRPAVQTVSGGEYRPGDWSVSLAPDEEEGIVQLIGILDSRKVYGSHSSNITLLAPEGVVLSSSAASLLEDHGYSVETVSYSLPLTKAGADVLFSGQNRPGEVILSFPAGAEDLTLLLDAARMSNSLPSVWYVSGDVILGDPKVVQSVQVYDYLAASDIWSSELGKSKPLVRDVSLFYSKVYPGQSMTGVSARSFEAVVMLADAMSVSGSTTPAAVGSALKNLRYSVDQSIFSGSGISFDESGNVVGPETMLLQSQGGTMRVVLGAGDLISVAERQM
ncbi:hypothetical protein [Methanorbis furvi]|uniref:Leucine-binding protein domain-containing protein n=1 Tax=Methanorbis furvi TaxID=3028299 RepID=A0AAE4S9P6_9EURY|nr:hypothetical protein [Methanocorpusculaceae archaeon Ag1]